MTNEMLPLAKCPYCDRDHLIAVSTAAVPEYHRFANRSWDLHGKPHQTLLIFNCFGADHTPCPQLLGSHGECMLSKWKSNPWTEGDVFDFCWWPRQMQNPITNAVFDRLRNRSVPDHLKGDIPVQQTHCLRCWSAAGDGYRGKDWTVDGYVYFCADIRGFVEAAPALMKAK